MRASRSPRGSSASLLSSAEAESHADPRTPPREQSARMSPCLAAAFGTAERPGLARGALFGFVLVEHGTRCGLALGAEFVAVGAAPFVGGDARGVVPAEMRHHKALIELVGALGLLPIGPIMGLLQKDAKGALLLIEPLDQRDRVVGGADHAEIVLVEPFERVPASRDVEAALVVVRVVQIPLEAEARIRPRLLAGLGDV